MRVGEGLLWGVHDAALKVPLLGAQEELMGPEAGGEKAKAFAAGGKDGGGLRVAREGSVIDTAAINTELEQNPVRELSAEPELIEPVEDGLVVLGLVRGKAGTDIPPIGGEHLGLHGWDAHGVPAGLPLDRVSSHQPVKGPALRRDVGRRVHAHIDVLPATEMLPGEQRGEGSHDAKVLPIWKGWLPPPRTGGTEWSS